MIALAAQYLPVGFGAAHAAAIVLILALWGFYTPILGLLGRGSLNSQLHSVRLRWFEVHRVPRTESKRTLPSGWRSPCSSPRRNAIPS